MDRRSFLGAAAVGAGALLAHRSALPGGTKPLGNGIADDTAALQWAINDAQRRGTPLVLRPGTYRITLPLLLGAKPINLRGSGTTILKAGAAMAAVLDGMDTASSVIEDLTIDGAGLAKHGLRLQTVAATSTRNTVSRVRITGCTSHQFYLKGHEDSTLQDCYTPGAPALGVYLSVPNGAARIVGGALFGQLTLDEYQQVSITGSTFGPLLIGNAAGRLDRTLYVAGCYIYDSTLRRCLDTDTNLTNVTLDACYVVAQVWDAWLNGHLLEGVSVALRQTMFVQDRGNGSLDTFVMQSSGSGRVVFDGCVARLNSGAQVTAHRNVAGGTTVPTLLSPLTVTS